MRPFSQACENNKAPILARLRPYLKPSVTVWEIGSGTGQHAVYFAEQMPHIQWQPTDLPDALPGITAWMLDSPAKNVAQPLVLDVCEQPWPADDMDMVYTANTIHIIEEAAVAALFEGIGRLLKVGGLFFIYGPFIYGGAYTSESNAQFDLWLKARDPNRGIKSLEGLEVLGRRTGLRLKADHAMPANNQLLVWEKINDA